MRHRLRPALANSIRQNRAVAVAPAWTPAEATTSGGVLPGAWLKADALVLNDGDAVATWADSSGNSRDATEATNRPTYKTGIVNSKPVVRFDGTNDKLALANSLGLLRNLAGATIFVVHRPDAAALTGGLPIFFVNSNSSTKSLMQLWVDSDSLGAVGRRLAANSAQTVDGGVATPVFVNHGATVDWANSDLYVYVNGVEVGISTSFQTAGSSEDVAHTSAPLLGNANSTLWYKGDIAEVLVYRSALATADRQQVEGYLAAKYALPTARANGALPGAWSWFTNPRALYYNGKTYTGLIATLGDVTIHSIADSTYAAQSGLLHATLEADDHDNPSLLVRNSDKRLLAFYCQHNGATVYQRISTNPEDVTSWGTEASLDASFDLGGTHATYSYPNPVQLTGEANEPIYLFVRERTANGIWYSKSTDGGATWPAIVNIIANGTERPYFHVVKNGTDRIDIICGDGHPTEVSSLSVYHCYYTGGNLYKSDGTLIGAIGSGPYTPATHLTRVYNGATNFGWHWDIVIDGSGYPVIVYAQFQNSAVDQFYRYARWTGSAWVDNQIVAAGTYLYAGEIYYSGGICLDPANPNVVYLSRQVSSQWEIWKYTTANNGVSWDAGVAITSGSSVKNIRPYVPRGGGPLTVMWLKGTYTTFINYALTLESEPSYYA